jgi:hypothetical protein
MKHNLTRGQETGCNFEDLEVDRAASPSLVEGSVDLLGIHLLQRPHKTPGFGVRWRQP